MGRIRNPITGDTTRKVRVWFERAGESPTSPFTVRRWYEDRYIVVPGRLAGKEVEPMTISTEFGETPEPFGDGETPA